MTKLFTAAEIAEMRLPDLPTTKKAILTRAEKESWHYETKVGLGGVRKMFLIPRAYLPGYKPYGDEPKPVADTTQVGAAVRESDTGVATAANVPQGKVIGAVVAGSAQGDMDRIQLVIRAVNEWEEERGVKIDEARRPAVIAVLYDYVKKAEEAGEGDAGLERFLKALG